ncbi:acyl-CoA dehydrogenase [Mucilaginibacter sp. JRF]|uniref:acyl-CoA dehydrogenase n=1 Tax=Mucilaginibacter sp. JRF TaxID=2780088 RepID=UPI0018802AD0|nr:acyl-CoA dehydrogenase [Mucilaginibacter sp. JRF]MBE9584816.1 acyl-CoA dehydrogenase [Mucilaginibacter sp. JRF]
MHPSTLLKPEWVDIIRRHVPEAEKTGKLHPVQLALVHEQGWFKFLVPAAYAGLELNLPDQVRLEESLAWVNGSLGWVVTLCSGAGWFGGFIEPDAAGDIFANPQLCLAGSGAPSGTATITEDGYIINGEWKYASGIQHATHVTANCVIKQGDETVLNEDGSPLILPFVFNREDVNIQSAWKYVGMMCTGSDAYRVDNLFVPANRCFKIDASAAKVDGALYYYPFMQLAEATLTANMSGLAIHFTDLCETLFADKPFRGRYNAVQQQKVQQLLQVSVEKLNNARADFYQAVDASWQAVSQKADSAKELKAVSTTAHTLATLARNVVDELYPYCGLIAANPDTEINQVWRDLHTASQHSLFTFST